MQEGQELVRDLVDRFERNRTHYRSGDFDEASTREYFINPLFEALGWDVRDTAGRGPLRDVIYHRRLTSTPDVAGLAAWDDELTAEELAAREPAVAVPDYTFRIGDAAKFFVEAKKPSVQLRRRGPSFQVKSYAWSQRVAFAVLTDFEEFRVFNCTVRPIYEEPDVGLVAGLNLTFQQYDDAWDRLWTLLSREAVAAGSLDQLVDTTTPRGAVPVDEAFLRELEVWRAQLAEDLARNNHDLTGYQLAEATQRILDRLVFLRVCEDRGIESDVSLRRYARITDAYRAMRPQMRRLDAVYNGQLFAEHFSERLEVSDGLLQRIVAGLYFPAAYRFDAIDGDLLGAIYERFLGKEITASGRQVAVTDKPEVRHAGGVYYTPRWVVDRVVDATLAPLLTERRTAATPRTVANLRIVDPACGSGSFLIGALDWLVRWHEHYYEVHPDHDPTKHYRTSAAQRRLTTDAKAEIVTNCLFGLDIDPQAVEVAQMNLYLRILEEESALSIASQTRLFHGALLPSLASNVRCGNSLLSPDQIDRTLLYDEELRRRINPFNWHDERWGFGRVFADRGGFDAVIGNPPYTRVQVMRRYRPEETNAYARHYEAAQVGSFDIASLFVERALEILRPPGRDHKGGRLGFIVSRQSVETDAGRPVRRRLRDHVSEIVDFGTGLVFSASAYTLLLQATAGRNRRFRLIRVAPPPNRSALAAAEAAGSVLNGQLSNASLGDEPWSLSLPKESALLERLSAGHPSLGKVSGNSIFQGVVTGADGIFRATDVGPDPSNPSRRLVRPESMDRGEPPIALEQQWLVPVFAGRSSFRRFYVRPSKEWLLLPYERKSEREAYSLVPPHVLARRAPNFYRWLHDHRSDLENRRSGTWTEGNWYGYSRRQNLESSARRRSWCRT
jgi:N-6 DNA Methylase